MEEWQSSMESMAMSFDKELASALSCKRVFITGHTGFKGSWLTAWLKSYDCKVVGYSLAPDTQPNMFNLANLDDCLTSHYLEDIRDNNLIKQRMKEEKPEVVIHLAAQPLVRRSYHNPLETWSTNVMGTVNVLEAVRSCTSVKGVVVVVTDKCYENREWVWGYRETDPLGGHDPYSASKAAVELIVDSYRKSFFSCGGPLIASCRAGNVIGGGDWSEDRLIPDAARAVQVNRPLIIRNPESKRPWQHVLDCLYGYLLLACSLINGEVKNARAFNFGPDIKDNLSVKDMLTRLHHHWPELEWELESTHDHGNPHEAAFLYLDSSLAREKLGWAPRWDLDTALAKTAFWYKVVTREPWQTKKMIQQQLDEYINI